MKKSLKERFSINGRHKRSCLKVEHAFINDLLSCHNLELETLSNTLREDKFSELIEGLLQFKSNHKSHWLAEGEIGPVVDTMILMSSNHHISTKNIHSLYALHEPLIHKNLASSSKIDAKMIEYLSSSKDMDVIAALCKNPKTPNNVTWDLRKKLSNMYLMSLGIKGFN